jgi:hypothetical protein
MCGGGLQSDNHAVLATLSAPHGGNSALFGDKHLASICTPLK